MFLRRWQRKAQKISQKIPLNKMKPSNTASISLSFSIIMWSAGEALAKFGRFSWKDIKGLMPLNKCPRLCNSFIIQSYSKEECSQCDEWEEITCFSQKWFLGQHGSVFSRPRDALLGDGLFAWWRSSPSYRQKKKIYIIRSQIHNCLSFPGARVPS